MANVENRNPHNILRTGDFDPEKLVVTEAQKTKYNSLQSFINYPTADNPKGKVIYQTPIMYAPFGIAESRMNPEDEPKYYLELGFDATTDKLEGFHKKARDVFVGIDKRMIDIAVENSSSWFKKKKSRTVIADEKYKSALKCDVDEEGVAKNEYSDRLCFKILLDDKKRPNVEIYDHEKQRIECESVEDLMTLVHSGRKLKAIVQASSVWIGTTGCGISWKVLQIKLYPSGNEQLEDYAFDDSDDVEELE